MVATYAKKMEEIVVNPHTGRWWTVGTHGAEFVDIPKNAIVFNHKQSKALLENGSIFGRGKALASGTAMFGGSKSKLTGGTSGNSSNRSSSSSKSDSSSSSSDSDSKVDWIEIAVSRIKRSLDNFKNVMDDGSLKLKKRFKATYDTIYATNKELRIQEQAAARYLQEANSVSLSSDLKAKVRDGSISIGSYGEDTQKAIKEYQEAYEKFLDCSDAMKELKRSLADLFNSYVELSAAAYDNAISKLEYKQDKAQARIDLREAKGGIANTSDYEQMIKLENKRQKVLTKKRDKLSSLLSKAKNYGIQKGSDEWNDIYNQILDINRDIWDSNAKRQELLNSIKQTYVDRFEKYESIYDNTLTRNQHKQSMQQADMDLREAQGEKLTKSDYQKKISLEQGKQYVLSKKLNKLTAQLEKGLKDGIIKEGTEEYWQMIDAINSTTEELAESKVTIAELNNDIKQLEVQKFEDIAEEYDDKLDKNTHKQNTVQNNIDLREAQGKSAKISDYDRLIKLQERRQTTLDEKLAALIKQRNAAEKAGISKSDLKTMDDTIASLKEEIQQADIELANLNNDRRQARVDNFNKVADKYNKWITPREIYRDRYSKSNDLLKAQGLFESESNYNSMIWYENEQKRLLSREYEDLMKQMRESDFEMYSDEWFEMYEDIQNVLDAINDCTENTLNYQTALRELNDEMFDYKQTQIDQMTAENDFFLSLLDKEKQIDDKGNLTEYGEAAMGLHAVNYNTYMEKAANYAEEIQKYDKMIADDPNNQKLIERRQELLGLQQDSIKSAEDEKNAMVDLVKEGIDAQLESLSKLIDKYKESLSSAKNLYDYQQRIKEQTKNITTLEKQLSAYSGFDDEETKAKVQQLKVSLEEAKNDLKESEYDQYISDQEDLLDSLYDEYEEFMNSRLDDTNAIINEQFNMVNENQSNIWGTLQEIAAKENYDYTPEFERIFGALNGNIAGDMSNGKNPETTTGKTIKETEAKVDEGKKESDKKAAEKTPADQVKNDELKKSVVSQTEEIKEAISSGSYLDKYDEFKKKPSILEKTLNEAVSAGVISKDSQEYKNATSAIESANTKITEADEIIREGKVATGAAKNVFDSLFSALTGGSSGTDDKTPTTPAKKEEPTKPTTSTGTPVIENPYPLDKINTSQKKIAAAQKSGDLKKNPNKYKKEVANLKSLLDIAVKVGTLKKSDQAYKTALATYTAANKIVNPSKTTTTTTAGNKNNGDKTNTTTGAKTIKVGGKINAKNAKIYATPGGKATTQYFGNDPIYVVLAEKNGYVQVRYHKAKSGSSGWFKKSDVKAYKHGGLVDETGLAWLDGTPSKPETVLDAEDSKNLVSLRDVLKDLALKQGSVSFASDYSKYRGAVSSSLASMGFSDKLLSSISSSSRNINESINNTFGDTIISIDHVDDYNDLVTKMRDDKKFEKLIQSMTVGRLQGGSALAKNKYSWK